MCFQMFHHQAGKSIILEGYKDRLEPPSSPGTTKNVSVLLKDMQDTDSGLYTCFVTNLPDVQGESEAYIKVTVLGKLTMKMKCVVFYTIG